MLCELTAINTTKYGFDEHETHPSPLLINIYFYSSYMPGRSLVGNLGCIRNTFINIMSDLKQITRRKHNAFSLSRITFRTGKHSLKLL